MAGSTVAAFWAVSFLFVVTPGADWAYAITAGLRHRRKREIGRSERSSPTDAHGSPVPGSSRRKRIS